MGQRTAQGFSARSFLSVKLDQADHDGPKHQQHDQRPAPSPPSGWERAEQTGIHAKMAAITSRMVTSRFFRMR